MQLYGYNSGAFKGTGKLSDSTPTKSPPEVFEDAWVSVVAKF